MKNFKGITLIALIITIIVMMILVGVSVTIAINGGLFGASREASFKTMMSQYKEQVDTYSMEKRIDDYVNDTTSITDINAGATERTPTIEMKEILGKDVKKGYEEKIAVEAGELYYVPIDPNNNVVKNEVKWCFEIGVKVKGYDTYEDYEVGTIPVSDGSYEESGGIYVNTPDLTGFSKTHTYYVTYDENGNNETIGEKIIGKIPEGEVWYDYENKIWANVVTISNGNVAYWVWIPRYAYKITYYNEEGLTTLSDDEGTKVTQYGKIDVKFLSKENKCIEKTENGETKETTLDELTKEGYKLPESFTWDEKPIAGYWVSKYEVSEGASITFNIEKTATGAIKVFNTKSINCEGGTYNYYLDGTLKGTGTGGYTFEGLEPGRMYEIKVENSKGTSATRTVYAEEIITADSEPKTKPNLTGFNETNAYYVTYDEKGNNEKIGDKIQVDENGEPINAPEGWYNYQNKIWANIVTSNEELTEDDKANIQNTDKKIAYWVWIPRYEYRTIDSSTKEDYIEGDKALQIVSINFIDTNTTTPSEGYKIPESFSWDGRPISGYWVSKYEVSAAQ